MSRALVHPSADVVAAIMASPPVPVPPSGARAAHGAREAGLSRRRAAAALTLLAIVVAATIIGAMRRTSTTFDEIVLVAGGARGYQTGEFDLAPEHPPLMQYVYGLPVFFSVPHYPAEYGPPRADFGYRYAYAREFFWRAGNDPERVAFLGRLMAAASAIVLVLLTYGFAASRIGRGPALLAAGLVGFLPDVLAHGGVAYNDVPLAAAFIAAIWAFDAAARRPSWRTGVVAGLLLALALGVKFSAVTLLPVAVLIVGAEMVVQRAGRAWRRAAIAAAGCAFIAGYLGLVLIYRGDFALAEFWYGLDFTFRHVDKGHGAPGYLLNESSPTGWWYFFPVAFLFKTPAALHALAMIALYGAYRSVADRSSETEARGPGDSAADSALAPPGSAPSMRSASPPRALLGSPLRALLGSPLRALLGSPLRALLGSPLRALLGSPLRAAGAGAIVFGAALITSSLVIGFRYALPLLPMLCVLVAAGVAAVWRVSQRRLRLALAVLVLLYAASSLSYYPHFLAYISEYGPGRDRGDLVLLDSSLDWGQGLLELRDFMREEGIDAVYLSYFGSADPKGYGIDYLPLPSFFPLDAAPASGVAGPAKWAAISATNLHGVYLPGDPLARFREVPPDRVLANSLFLYRIDD